MPDWYAQAQPLFSFYKPFFGFEVKKMVLHYCRNQTREVSALTASLVTKKFALKYPTKSHFTLQTSSHPWKDSDHTKTIPKTGLGADETSVTPRNRCGPAELEQEKVRPCI